MERIYTLIICLAITGGVGIGLWDEATQPHPFYGDNGTGGIEEAGHPMPPFLQPALFKWFPPMLGGTHGLYTHSTASVGFHANELK